MNRPKKRKKTPGSGKKKGYKAPQTLEKLELQKQFRERIAQEIEPLAAALLRAAKGVEHLQAKDKRGQWMSVEDPNMMTLVLNGPEEHRRISAKDPDVRALKECFDRLFGAPTQHVEVEDVTPVAELSDEELHQELERLAKKTA